MNAEQPAASPIVRALRSPWALVPFAVAAFVLSLLGTSDRSFTPMEADLILAGTGTLGHLWHVLTEVFPDQSPLYPLMLHVWTRVLGDEPLTIRALSALWAAVAVVYAGLLGRAWRNPWVGLLAAAVLLAMPNTTAHGRTARMYIVFIACTAGAPAPAAGYLRWGPPRDLGGCVLLCVLGIYNHFLAFAVAGLALAYLVGGCRFGGPRRPLRPAWVAVGTVAALGLPQLIRLAAGWGHAAGMSGTYSVPDDPLAFVRAVNRNQLFDGTDLGFVPLSGQGPFWLLFGLTLVLVVWGIHNLPDRWDRVHALLWFAGSQLIFFGLRVAVDADLRPRYFTYLMPAVAVLVASAVVDRPGGGGGTLRRVGRIGRRLAFALVLAGLGAAMVAGAVGRASYQTRPYDEIVAWIEVQRREGDVVAALPGWSASGLRYYTDGEVVEADLAAWRRDPPDGKVFLVHSREGSRRPQRLLTWLGARGRRITARPFRRTRIYVYQMEDEEDLELRPFPVRDAVVYSFRDHLSDADLAIVGGPFDGAEFTPHRPDPGGHRRPEAVRRWKDDWWSYVGKVVDSSAGVEREGIWAHPARDGVLELRYPAVPLGARLDGFLGISDEIFDRQEERGRRPNLSPTTIEVHVDGRLVEEVRGGGERGWRRFRIDTSAHAGSTAPVTFRIHAPSFANHYLSFDAWTVDPAPVAATPVALPEDRGSPLFREHLDGAQVGLHREDGRYRPCSDPIPGAGYIPGEEQGPDGEGRLSHRRRCGDEAEAWKVVAATRQRAGGELRDCIWAHPVDDAALEIHYPEVQLGGVLSGIFGITDLALDRRDFPVYLQIETGDQVLFRGEVADEPGWHEFAVDTGPWRDEARPLTLRIETDKQRWRHLCLDVSVH